MERYEVIRTLWKNEQIKHLNIVVSEYKDVKKKNNNCDTTDQV